MDEKIIREQLKKSLLWHDAHADWKQAIVDFPTELRGIRPNEAPYSAWELLEHARISQWDILEFCRNPKHVSPEWPSKYWPSQPAPPDPSAWDASWKAFHRDTEAMAHIVADPKTDLAAPIPHGSGQTIFREALILVDHNSYHVGQFIILRRLLGSWSKT